MQGGPDLQDLQPQTPGWSSNDAAQQTMFLIAWHKFYLSWGLLTTTGVLHKCCKCSRP